MLLLDNLSDRTRLWYALAADLANEQVSFLITTREEDWFRYGSSTAGFTWDVIRPQLRLDEATRIFADLRKRGRIAPGVTSALWAFERVYESRLLIEYIYLVTHGRLLEERLAEQIGRFRALEEDPGKLEALRLVSVAQRYGARVPAQDLVRHSGFRMDPQQSLRSLVGEYLSCTEGICEGLHPVRSEHLIPLLHDPLPVEDTLAKLISWLDPENLQALVETAFADPSVDIRRPMEALVNRCVQAPPTLTGNLARTCFRAEEQRYFLRHKHLFDQAYADGGEGYLFLLITETLPSGTVDLAGSLADIHQRFEQATEVVQDLAMQFSARIPDQRFEHLLLTRVLERLSPDALSRNLAAFAEILHWCHASSVRSPTAEGALRLSDWQDGIFQLSVEHAAALSFALSRVASEEHRAWTHENLERIQSFFKWGTRTFVVAEHAQGIRLRFPVQTTGTSIGANDQAVNRLHLLHQLLPYYARYDSEGIYLIGEESLFPNDEAHKQFAAEGIWQLWDTRLNAAWCEICEDRYAADSVTTWLREWRAVRERCLSFLTHLYGCYQRAYRGAQATIVQRAALNELPGIVGALQKLPRPPGALAPADRDRMRKLTNDWSFYLGNFLSQFPGHDPNEDDSKSRLMRHNLWHAVYALGDVERADTLAASLVGLEPLPDEFSRREREDYRRLAEVLECWFDRPEGYADDLSRAISRWRQRRHEGFVSAVAACLDPLRGPGLELVPPSRPLIEYPLVSICIGLEVQDFRTLLSDVLRVVATIGNLDLIFDFVCVIPIIRGRCFRTEMFRVGKDAAGVLAQGGTPHGLWLLPVEIPAEVRTILPGVRFEPLQEWELLSKALQPLERLAWHLALALAFREWLDPSQEFEGRLLDELSQDAAAAEEREQRAMDAGLRSLRQFAPPPAAAVAWNAVVNCCASLLPLVRQNPRAAGTLLVSNLELETTLQQYLNAAYLGLAAD